MTALSSAEVHRWLKLVAGSVPALSLAPGATRNIPDRWYLEQCPVPLSALRRISGVGGWTLQLAIDGNHHIAKDGDTGSVVPGIGRLTCEKLTPYIRAIEEGRLVFVPVPAVGRGAPRWEDRWLTPPSPQPAQPYLTDAGNWGYWRRCRACGGRKWMPVEMNGQPMVVCYYCLPPLQWPNLRMAPRKEHLVLRELRRIPFAHADQGHAALGGNAKPTNVRLPK